MTLILSLILVAMVLGLIGTVVEGLLALLVIGVIVFVAAVLLAGLRAHRAYNRTRR